MNASVLDAVHTIAVFTASNAVNAFSMLLDQSTKRTDRSCALRRHPFLHPLLDVIFRLLHRVQFPVPRHSAVVLAILAVQSLQPLSLPVTLLPRCLPRSIPRRLFQLTDHRVLHLVLPSLRYHGESVPLHLVIAVFQLVQGVVERVKLRFGLACHAQDGAGLWIALDFDLFNIDSLLRLFRDDIQTVRRAVGAGVGARGLGVVEAKKLDRLFCATCCVVEARCETETTVVL